MSYSMLGWGQPPPQQQQQQAPVLTPEMLTMLAQLNQRGSSGAVSGEFPPSAQYGASVPAPTPMARYLGAPADAIPPGLNGNARPPQQIDSRVQQIIQLMQAQRGLPDAQNPNPNWLQQTLGGNPSPANAGTGMGAGGFT